MSKSYATGPKEKLERKSIISPDFDESLVAAFERVATAFPSHIALASEMWEPTYRELNETGNRLAHRLIACGVATEDRVCGRIFVQSLIEGEFQTASDCQTTFSISLIRV